MPLRLSLGSQGSKSSLWRVALVSLVCCILALTARLKPRVSTTSYMVDLHASAQHI
jgi:hypothetical protein